MLFSEQFNHGYISTTKYYNFNYSVFEMNIIIYKYTYTLRIYTYSNKCAHTYF